MTRTKRAVVVGIDGSDAAHGAFAYAAWEAHRRHGPLRLVHAHGVPPPYGLIGLAPDPTELDRTRRAGADLLADYRTRARTAFPSLRVDGAVVADSPGAALVAASQDAALVVVGSRGLGGFTGLLLGSVGTQLAAYSHAPVIVMRPPGYRGQLGAALDRRHRPPRGRLSRRGRPGAVGIGRESSAPPPPSIVITIHRHRC